MVDCANKRVGINREPTDLSSTLQVNGNISGNRGLNIYDTSPSTTIEVRGNDSSRVYAYVGEDTIEEQGLYYAYYFSSGQYQFFIMNASPSPNDLLECKDPGQILITKESTTVRLNMSMKWYAVAGAPTDQCIFDISVSTDDKRYVFTAPNQIAETTRLNSIDNERSAQFTVLKGSTLTLSVQKKSGVTPMPYVYFTDIEINVIDKEDTSMIIKTDANYITADTTSIYGRLLVINPGPNVGIYTTGWLYSRYGLYITDDTGKEFLYVEPVTKEIYFGDGKDNKILIVDTANYQVGILTPNPTATLDVNGTMLVNGTMKAGELFFVDVPNNIIEISAPTVPFGFQTGNAKNAAAKALVVDAANSRVGIGLSVPPQRTLDVQGDAIVRGSFWADTYENLPSMTPDVLPITLDKTNNRVGINKTVPVYALDVTEDINCTSTYKINGINVVDVSANDTTIALGQTNTVPALSTSAVAIGYQANVGVGSVAIGNKAGQGLGMSTVSIGTNTGRNLQGNYSVAIGINAGETQGSDCVAVGHGAGNANQQMGSVAVGVGAGNTGQGSYAVAIGPGAGQTNQHARTICLSASTGALNTDRTDALFIQPIRNTTTTPTNVLTYNTATKEVTYGPFSGSSTAVGSSMMVTNQSLSCPVNQDVILTLPSTGALASTFSKGCTETTTAVSCAPMGVTYQKTGVIQFTQTGCYQFNLRTTKSGAVTPGARLIAFIFRLNGVNVNDSDVQTFAANNDEPELFINFVQYVDATKVNELYYKYYNNNSASTIKFSVTITRIA